MIKEHYSKVATEISHLVNNTLFNGKEVAKVMVKGDDFNSPMHRYLQSEFFDLAIAYIFELATAKENGRYDARNETACIMSSEIVRLIKENGSVYEQNPYLWSLINRHSKN